MGLFNLLPQVHCLQRGLKWRPSHPDLQRAPGRMLRNPQDQHKEVGKEGNALDERARLADHHHLRRRGQGDIIRLCEVALADELLPMSSCELALAYSPLRSSPCR